MPSGECPASSFTRVISAGTRIEPGANFSAPPLVRPNSSHGRIMPRMVRADSATIGGDCTAGVNVSVVVVMG
ncbi:hypothetical protein CWC39_07985 [Corynebacterium heidelbergense]|uniref:Uncharacterized protein n=1 Tax=Corynebacterium heidelbergense TaxID=2055947 RepID=A0A364VAD8_9CORY|nr:hypothetical protein CWC39_07985 [Corynebacterium heidelbergense]